MKLTDLHPKLYRTTDGARADVPPSEAQLLTFVCPVCKSEDDRVHVPLKNHPNAWDLSGGDSLEQLTLRPSIQAMQGCRWHGFITNGEVTNA